MTSEITPALLREWGVCWTDEAIAETYSRLGVSAMTPLEILAAEGVSAANRLWVVLRECVIPAGPLRLLACDFAERALERIRDRGREPDPRFVVVISVSRQFAAGEATRAELDAARRAAWDTAWDTAGDTAGRAAWDTAWDTARNTAWSAACSAATGTARDAAWDTAWSAAWSVACSAATGTARDAALAAAREWQVDLAAKALRGVDRRGDPGPLGSAESG